MTMKYLALVFYQKADNRDDRTGSGMMNQQCIPLVEN